MAWDYAENIFQLLASLTSLLLCLFCYISNKHRAWLYALLFFLTGLLSSYYWTTYMIIMGSWPTVSDLVACSGWDLAYLCLFLLVMHMKTPEKRRFFHPLMLIAVPLDAVIVTLYLFSPVSEFASQVTTSIHDSYLLNNLYLVIICNLVGIFSLQDICWYWKKHKDSDPVPWISVSALLIVLFGFAMLITSNLYGPVTVLYYPSSFLCSASYLFFVWAVRRSVPCEGKEELTSFERKTQNILKATSLGIVLVFSVGGVMLGMWIRDVITEHIDPADAASVYDIIPIVLFVISLILTVFVIAIIFVVYFSQRAAENGRLREARQVAERSNAAKSEFLAAMSHEIRTPINAVLGMNEVILRESRQTRDRLPEDSNGVRRTFDDICGCSGIIDTAGKNLLSIINDILDISKIEAGKMEIREDFYRLSSLLGDVCSLIGVRAQARNLEFCINVDESLPYSLYGDAVHVRQVMLNILNNAVKYTARGSVTLSVYSDTKSGFMRGQDMNLIISVRDTGIGIRKEDMDKLFTKFERIGLTESDGVEGTGLGLMIVKNLLNMMNGSVQVESEYGKGSVFTVTIPQKVVSEEPIGDFRVGAEQGGQKPGIPQERFRAPEAHILVVDDTRMNLTVVEGLLKNTGMQIDTAAGGEEALRLSLSVPYDLILLDQRMPGMDGIETMHRIRARESGVNRQIPIICLTADAVSDARKRYLAEGFTDYLSKPIDSAALREKLIKYLPPEKVLLLSAEEEPACPPEAEDDFAKLQEAGIDAAQGLAHCQGDRGLYRSLLGEFAGDAAERAGLLEKAFAAGAWKDYGLQAHSLKSTSGTIGALRLSDAAATLEAAAKQEDTEALRDGHAPLLDLYRQTAGALQSFHTGADASPPEDEDIIEFMPDE